jgi:hypothetical protein
MGLRKFRSVADMPGPAPLQPLAPDNVRLAFSLMEMARRLGRISHVPGIRKFRSLEEAQASRSEREKGGTAPPAGR